MVCLETRWTPEMPPLWKSAHAMHHILLACADASKCALRNKSFYSKIASKAYPIDTLHLVFLQKAELLSVCEMSWYIPSDPESKPPCRHVVGCPGNFCRILDLRLGLDRLNKNYLCFLLNFPAVLKDSCSALMKPRPLVNGVVVICLNLIFIYLFLCVCVFVKPERLKHCEVALRPKTRNLRTSQILTWSSEYSLHCRETVSVTHGLQHQ